MSHPYRSQPARAFWARSVAENFDEADIGDGVELLKPDDRIVTAGSCFASNLVPFLEEAGFDYVRTERRHPILAKLGPDQFGYDQFSARYGNIYTPRQLLQLLRRAAGRFVPAEDRWHAGPHVIDPFRPGLRFPASSDREFDLITKQHLLAVREAFSAATCVILTLGLTEAWISKRDGAVFPACPGTIAGTYDPEHHVLVNFSVADIVSDIREIWEEIQDLNATARLILTVSPVPLVATAGPNHVVSASTYSKSVLRVAAEEITRAIVDARYFPAYEIVTGSQAPHAYFETDRRSVSRAGVEAVMRAFLSRCARPDGTVPAERHSATPAPRATDGLGAALAQAECEEMMQAQ